MKSMLLAAVSVGLITASILLYLRKKNRSAEQEQSTQPPLDGSPIRMGQHAMG